MDEVKMLLSGILQQTERLNEKMERIETKMERIETKVERIEKRLDDMLQRWDMPDTQISEIRRGEHGTVNVFHQPHAQSIFCDVHSGGRAENITAEQRNWCDALRVIRSQIGQTAFLTWFAETHATHYHAESATLTVEAPTAFIRNWLQEKYADMVENALNTVTGREYRVSFVCQEAALVR